MMTRISGSRRRQALSTLTVDRTFAGIFHHARAPHEDNTNRLKVQSHSYLEAGAQVDRGLREFLRRLLAHGEVVHHGLAAIGRAAVEHLEVAVIRAIVHDREDLGARARLDLAARTLIGEREDHLVSVLAVARQARRRE
eukprot:7382250-Prymnesium_polylepis.1